MMTLLAMLLPLAIPSIKLQFFASKRRESYLASEPHSLMPLQILLLSSALQ